MRITAAILLAFIAFGSAARAQNEQAPIVEKEVAYKNWTYKSVRDGSNVDLRELARGKKLVAVVYFAPWCGNWRHDAPMLERLYQKYKADGLEIVAVGEYDPVGSMKSNIDTMKLTFPMVYESESRDAKQKTSHYEYRRSTGDTRNWGSPWYIFLDPSQFPAKGDVLTTKTSVINGEMIEAEGEKFIRRKLGLGPGAVDDKKVGAFAKTKIEICEPAKPSPLTKP
ncbi:MAG: peroxiredoxin family protein [Pyrinomonadaceae bacterium]